METDIILCEVDDCGNERDDNCTECENPFCSNHLNNCDCQRPYCDDCHGNRAGQCQHCNTGFCCQDELEAGYWTCDGDCGSDELCEQCESQNCLRCDNSYCDDCDVTKECEYCNAGCCQNCEVDCDDQNNKCCEQCQSGCNNDGGIGGGVSGCG